jgi:hypothetical protein
VVQHAASAFIPHTMDDILYTTHELKTQLPPDQSMQLEHSLLKDLYKVLNVKVDVPPDPNGDIILRNQYMQRILSVQASIGEKSVLGPRSLPSKVAWVVLNLREIALTMAFSYLKPAGSTEQGTDLNKPGIP